MTSFKDILKSNFIDNIASFSILDMVIALGLSLAIGLFIFFVYKKTFKGVLYSSSFGVSLIAMCLITTFIILAVTSNIVLSLGMVGALSIVRFRTAVKEPLDIAYMFWAIASGIVLGSGMIPLAIFGSVLIGVVMVIFVNQKSNDSPFILVINCDTDSTEETVTSQIKKNVLKFQIKSKTVSTNGIELTVEIRLKDETTKFINDIASITGVSNCILVGYNGEYMS